MTMMESTGIIMDTIICLLSFISVAILFSREWIDVWKIDSHSAFLKNQHVLMVASITNVAMTYLIILYTMRFMMDYLSTEAVAIYLLFSILQATWYITSIYHPKSLVPMPYSNVTLMALQLALFYCLCIFLMNRWKWYLHEMYIEKEQEELKMMKEIKKINKMNKIKKKKNKNE